MTRIAVELVPRDKNTLIEELKLIKERFPSVNTINIPDILRYEMASWEGCVIAREFFNYTIPHIRAIDFDKDSPLPIGYYLVQHKIGEVLIIAGDRPEDSPKSFSSTTIDIIKKFKCEMPKIKVYASLDPYRGSFRQEYEYFRKKIDAGVEGFFTQPFFDLRLMEIFSEWLGNFEVFWGVSPVVTERGKVYWETKNNVIFPKDFVPALEWNKNFAKKAINFVQEKGDSIYFMPIKMDIGTYLEGIL